MNKKLLFAICAILLLNRFLHYTENDSTESTTSFSVDVKGAVKKPGVYEYKKPTIVNDILADVGLISTSDTACINLANEISENTVLTIPTVEQCSDSSLININLASAQEISLLDGIGETRAQDIVDYRLENGSFSSTEEIKLVPGIGETTYENIKDYITI